MAIEPSRPRDVLGLVKKIMFFPGLLLGAPMIVVLAVGWPIWSIQALLKGARFALGVALADASEGDFSGLVIELVILASLPAGIWVLIELVQQWRLDSGWDPPWHARRLEQPNWLHLEPAEIRELKARAGGDDAAVASFITAAVRAALGPVASTPLPTASAEACANLSE